MLEKHLRILALERKIAVWQDRGIPPSVNWRDQIAETYLNEADIVLLLVSASFIASSYCWNIEVQAALERHKARTARVIPIILRPTRWQDTPLGQLQVLPTGAIPVTRWIDQDAAFTDVVQGIRKVVEELRRGKVAKTKEQWILEGKNYYQAHEYEEALAAYQNALELDAGDGFVRETLGHIQIQLGRYNEAFATYEELLRRSPSASAYLFKGLVLQRVGRSVEALEAYQKAREYGYSG